ncbi:MAG: ferrous iron transport protein A [Lachnospiraceae bacterium]
MTLFEASKEKEYEIKNLLVEEAVTRRLQALGLNDGVRVRVLNRKKKGALIIKVRGTRLALGKHLSANIEVEEVQSCPV